MVDQANSPFIEEIMREKVPPKFRLHAIKQYNGSTDSIDHLNIYREWMDIYGVTESIRCKVFPFTLTIPTRIWFRQQREIRFQPSRSWQKHLSLNSSRGEIGPDS